MAIARTYAWIWIVPLIGWSIYTGITLVEIYYSIDSMTMHDEQYITPMPHDITALMEDIISQPMPYAMQTEGTIAADMLDQYIMIGNVFHDLSSNIQQFVMAHEMAHYHEKHHTHDIVLQAICLPLILLVILLTACYSARLPVHRLYYAWLRGSYHICTRTFGLHAQIIQTGIYYGIQVLACICISGIVASTCNVIHVYSADGFNQYIEYRADITAICQTGDADAPCALFDQDERNPRTHPSDPNRRHYIRHCQTHGFRPHTWYEMALLLTPQQITGALLFAATQHIPISYIADTWIPYITMNSTIE